jgi:hypothetical protein
MYFSNVILDTPLCFQYYVQICKTWKYAEGIGVTLLYCLATEENYEKQQSG